MAYDPAGGGPVSNPSVSYATTAGGGGAKQQAVKSGGGNRTGSVSNRKNRKAQTSKVKDAGSGTGLITNDKTFGLDRPYLAWNTYPTAEESAPTVTTTSGSFVSLLTCAIEPQHPRIRVRVSATTGAATTGEVRLVDRATGTVLAGPLLVGAAATVEGNLDGVLIAPTLSGAGAPMKVDVQARRTAGANTIGVVVIYAVGIGSA